MNHPQYHHHHHRHHHHHQDMTVKKFSKILVVVMVVIVVNEISVPLYNHVSSQSLHYFILLWLYTLYLSHQVHATARSRGFISSWFQDLAGNKPLTVLVKKVSVTKWINVPKKKKSQKTWSISGAKSMEKWSFLYHLFVVAVVFVCLCSIKMGKLM